MKRRPLQLSAIAIMGIILFIGGFFMMKKWNTPNTPAFQDEFTKQFLNAKAETPEGFHLFESWTHKYTMLYPEDYAIVYESYYRKKSKTSEVPNTENLYLEQMNVTYEQDKMLKGINLFLKPDGKVIIDSRLRSMLRKINAPENTEIEEYKDDGKIVYYAENIDDYQTENNDINRYYYLYGLIVDNHSKQALYFELEDTCFHINESDCNLDFDEEKQMGLKMMKSVEFN